jgi:hypothetical protein
MFTWLTATASKSAGKAAPSNRRDPITKPSPVIEESEMESAHAENHRLVGKSLIGMPEVKHFDLILLVPRGGSAYA